MKFKLTSTIIAIIVTIGGLKAQNICPSPRFLDSIFSNSQIKKDSNIVYAVSKNDVGQMQSLQLDIYYPQNSVDTMSKRPLIILIHGGSFLLGNRNDMAFQCREYAKRGYVAATLTYRLGWSCTATDIFGVCVFCQGQYYRLYNAMYRATQDARAATRYLVSNAATFKVDTSRLFIGGESAGSITAMMTAFWTQSEAERFCGVGIRNTEGLLDTAGNALRVGYTFKGIVNNCGAIDRDSSLFDENIPMASFHDDADCVVPFTYGRLINCCAQSFPYMTGSSAIHDKLKSRSGRYSELHWIENSLNHCSYPPTQLVKKASCFMKRVMCNNLGTSFSEKTVYSNPVCSTTPTNEMPPSVNDDFATIFPNPMTDVLTISIKTDKTTFPISVKITDILGRIIVSKNVYITDFQIENLKSQAKGTYFIEIGMANQYVYKKIIKQ